ncbi:ParM/StbA family protein [Acidiphilium sp. C61]|uniref:ParM/StbA family protein n=1 Tax=Acidiphilium sp. C61 TaxID=1671485 RepID=UPI00157A9B38|nr:ParM/StbA family protein [Acidiphilium sp. C61]
MEIEFLFLVFLTARHPSDRDTDMSDAIQEAPQKVRPRKAEPVTDVATGLLEVAIDDGYAQMKLCGRTHDGRIRVLKMPSMIRAARAGAMIDFDGSMVGVYRTAEGQSFVCGDDVRGEDTRVPDFHVSQMNRVLVHHVLQAAGYGEARVRLLTSLPVDEYFAGDSVNRDRIAAKTANLREGVQAVAGPGLADIADVKVGCQGLAAYFDLLLDDAGRERIGRLDAVAVVDIGGSTTDIAVVLNGSKIDSAASGTARVGVLDLQNDLARRLSARFGFEPKRLDQAVRTRTVNIWGEKTDIGAELDASVDEITAQIEREISRRIGNAGNIDKVLFVGGGAVLLSGLVSHWRNAVLAEDPEFANARGLLKYAARFAA